MVSENSAENAFRPPYFGRYAFLSRARALDDAIDTAKCHGVRSACVGGQFGDKSESWGGWAGFGQQ